MLNTTRKILIGALLPLLSAPAWSAGYEFARFNYTNLYSKDTKISAAYTWFTYDIAGTSSDGQPTGNDPDRYCTKNLAAC
ncbi:hypothetical protein [Vibrio gangliei]|uniref:hypothetical protein n=1 Tax=Vibrio gangliei TaxID=2077090 RepID=UPI001473B165|nr:hypothetical protein [Vibrio gangliei]